MSRAARWSALHGTQYMNLSFCGFAFWWFTILTVHLVTCVYNIGYVKLYWGFELTLFSYLLEYKNIGMPHQAYHSIAYVYMVLAGVHGSCGVMMIAGSLWQRKLTFSPRRRKIKIKSSKTIRERNIVDAGDTNQPAIKSTAQVMRFLSAVYHNLGSHHGMFGVKGKHFHIILLCRELVEVALQTVQAIRMSKYLPRLLLNRFYVSLLVINCWSSVFVYSRWFWGDEARRRFAATVCDCVLNLMTTMGVSLIIMLSYIEDYDVNDFDWKLLEDDDWFSQMLNEARVVLVMSWCDLATRAIFSLGLAASTADMKALLRYTPTHRNQVTSAVGPTVSLIRIPALAVPGGHHEETLTSEKIPAHHSRNNLQLVGRPSSYNNTGLRTRSSRILLQIAHYAFAMWGVVILSLHVHATMQSPLLECTPKVYPMAGALPSCYAMKFNCYNLGISASKEQMKTEWDRFDRSTTVKLRILHCQSLEIPDSFRDFSGLENIVVYNSTIVDWGATSAITNTRHPKLEQLSVVRVNMTDGILPLGFQSLDFPAYLGQIKFCETNLESLPDDLDSKWLGGSVVFLENSKLAAVPPALVRAQPYYLVIAGNPITELPSELFEGNIQYVFIGRTQVKELPNNVTPTTLSLLDITNTSISFFPSWIEPLVEATIGISPLLIAGGSTYCSDLEKITSGVSADFSSPFQSGQSSLLMNASEANWELLRQAVDCSPPHLTTQFSLDNMDVTYGLDDTSGGR